MTATARAEAEIERLRALVGVCEHTIRSALATLCRTHEIENRNRLWFPLDPRLLGPRLVAP